MSVQELPLFSLQVPVHHTPITSKAETPQKSIRPLTSEATLENLLQNIFPQNRDENKIIQTRKLLGKTAEGLSDEQIHCIVSEFQFLINSWLDEYEKGVFGGKTLKEVLNEK